MRRPALVITDLMMPYLNGAERSAALHDDAMRDELAAVPVIRITAGSLMVAHAAGADVVLPKPCDLVQVEALLQQFLGDSPGMPEQAVDA